MSSSHSSEKKRERWIPCLYVGMYVCVSVWPASPSPSYLPTNLSYLFVYPSIHTPSNAYRGTHPCITSSSSSSHLKTNSHMYFFFLPSSPLPPPLLLLLMHDSCIYIYILKRREKLLFSSYAYKSREKGLCLLVAIYRCSFKRRR